MTVEIIYNTEDIDLVLTVQPERLGEEFAAFNSYDQMQFLIGLVSGFKAYAGDNKWPFQASYIADEFKDNPYKALVKDYLRDLVECLEVEEIQTDTAL